MSDRKSLILPFFFVIAFFLRHYLFSSLLPFFFVITFFLCLRYYLFFCFYHSVVQLRFVSDVFMLPK